MTCDRTKLIACMMGLAWSVSLLGCGESNDPGAAYYGDQGGESVVTADTKNAPLRAKKGLAFYKLSKLRKGKTRFGRNSLSVDYETAEEGQKLGYALVLSLDKNKRERVPLGSLGRDSFGTIEVEEVRFGPPSQSSGLPDTLEVYLEAHDPVFTMMNYKVSNSTTMGWGAPHTAARNWTAEEVERIAKAASAPASPTLPTGPQIGKDTPFAGSSTGGGSSRQVDPGKKPLLGVEYRLGSWANQECLARLQAVFESSPPSGGDLQRATARDGYAVGGINVAAVHYVNAVQLIFMKLKADGQLDPADSYTSDWLGTPGSLPTVKLAGDGTRVIGLHCRQGAILDALALVTDSP